MLVLVFVWIWYVFVFGFGFFLVGFVFPISHYFAVLQQLVAWFYLTTLFDAYKATVNLVLGGVKMKK